MANSGREKKVRLTVNVDESNFVLLKWLKINWQDDYSYTINCVLKKHFDLLTEGMSEFEKEQIRNLKVVGERSAIDLKRINNLRSAALMDKVDNTLKDEKKRQAIKALLELYEK